MLLNKTRYLRITMRNLRITMRKNRKSSGQRTGRPQSGLLSL
jgi:hypothetical protein